MIQNFSCNLVFSQAEVCHYHRIIGRIRGQNDREICFLSLVFRVVVVEDGSNLGELIFSADVQVLHGQDAHVGSELPLIPGEASRHGSVTGHSFVHDCAQSHVVTLLFELLSKLVQYQRIECNSFLLDSKLIRWNFPSSGGADVAALKRRNYSNEVNQTQKLVLKIVK